MTKDQNIEIFRAMRKAIQLGVSNVELDADQAAAIVPMLDEWVSGGKYKKGDTCRYEEGVYRCAANVNKSETAPNQDADHWTRVDVAGDGVEVWTSASGKGYQKGDRVHYPDSDGAIYVSQKNNNKVEPGTDEKYWKVE